MESIKKEAKEFFSQKEYLKAIDSLNQLGVDDFVVFAKRENRKEKKKSWFKQPQFLSALLLRPELFAKVFRLKNADELLHDYFNSSNFLPQFEEKLAFAFPQLFISAIRVNMAFMQKERIDYYARLTLPNEYLAHLKTWKHLFDQELAIWEPIEADFLEIIESSMTIDDILGQLTIILEQHRFNDNSNKKIESLANAYSVFVNIFFSKPEKHHQFKGRSNDTLHKAFLNNLSAPIDSGLKKIFDQILNWITFRDTVLYPYCFDFSIHPEELNKTIIFSRTPQNYYKWELDGVRYNLNRLNYFSRATEIIDFLINKKEISISKGRNSRDEYNNYKWATEEWMIKSFLEDLKLHDLAIDGQPVSFHKIASHLIGFSRNRKAGYEESLAKHFKSSTSWVKAFGKLLKESEGKMIEISPIFSLSKSDFVNPPGQSAPVDETSEKMANLLTWHQKTGKKLNRFNMDFDVRVLPFIALGNNLFCPTMFLARNDWFYGLAQAGIENLSLKSSIKVRKETATQMEKDLGETFKKKKWNVKVISDRDANKLKGDVDVIVDDGNTTLLIQLKRTKFRLSLQEVYYETINPDRKASQQLNDAEKFLTSPNSIYTPNNETHKWLVTTSFENVLTKTDDCLKVNYFDLLEALNSSETNTLNQLISFIQEDRGLKNWLKRYQQKDLPEELKSFIRESGFPLPLSEPGAYKQLLFTDDNSWQKYHKLFNKGIDMGQKGRIDEAIEILVLCAKENPADYQVWSTLANYYADIKDFPNSFFCFEKAIEIIPEDPYILRNYAFALRESGNHIQGYELYKHIEETYWFTDLT